MLAILQLFKLLYFEKKGLLVSFWVLFVKLKLFGELKFCQNMQKGLNCFITITNNNFLMFYKILTWYN